MECSVVQLDYKVQVEILENSRISRKLSWGQVLRSLEVISSFYLLVKPKEPCEGFTKHKHISIQKRCHNLFFSYIILGPGLFTPFYSESQHLPLFSALQVLTITIIHEKGQENYKNNKEIISIGYKLRSRHWAKCFAHIISSDSRYPWEVGTIITTILKLRKQDWSNLLKIRELVRGANGF